MGAVAQDKATADLLFIIEENKTAKDQLRVALADLEKAHKIIEALRADIGKLEDFRSIIEKPLYSLPVYFNDKRVINLMRATLVKTFGRMYDIGDSPDDKTEKKIVRDRYTDFVQACVEDVCKFWLDSVMSRHFPEAEFRR